MEGIKNIIFDLGGVILNIDYDRPIKAFQALGIIDFNDMYSKMQQSDLFDRFETGSITGRAFISALQQLSPKPLQESSIIDAWNAILLDFPLRRLQILQQLQLHYNTFLLSNTNEIHEQAFNRLLAQTTGDPTLAVFFDKIYLSHRIGLRKPDPRAFELILQENKLKAEETLFIDDSIQHIETAAVLGIRTIHMAAGMTMEKDIFKQKSSL